MSLLVQIEKQLGDFQLRVDFTAEDGVLSLLGASGCGKSMTLKCIAGICKPDKGRIVLNGVTLFDSAQYINLPPQKRRVGYLFQQYALFPHMTVEQNLSIAVRDKQNAPAIVAEMVQRMQLTGLEQHLPHQLSGGQQQRTALARILVNAPEVLLLDEPFSALDAPLRFQMETEVRRITQRFGKPTLMVSHDPEEVYRLSDRVAILAAGHVESIGPKEQIFAQPQTRSGAILTECRNISRIRPLEGGKIRALDWGITLPEIGPGYDCVGIRARDIRPGPNVPCHVTSVMENPFSVTVQLHPDGADPQAALIWELDKTQWAALQGAEV